MKRKFLLRIATMALATSVMCSVCMSASADSPTGVVAFTSGGVSYVAAVTNTQNTTSKEVPIASSAVPMAKYETRTFGKCTYAVSISNNIWGSAPYQTYLNTAGAKVDVSTSFSKNVEFTNQYTFTAKTYAGTFCAATIGYGYVGSYCVDKYAGTSTTVASGSFTFAPCGCSNVIKEVVDVNLF